MSLKLPKVKGTLDGISPLIVGGAVFNTQYNDDPSSIPVKNLLLTAFKNGINAIDTSPYYGPSEILLGQALKQLISVDNLITRDNFYVCTKVGRIQLDDFDYSPSWVRKSITRSLNRFNTSYLDVVFLHDVEFVDLDGIYAALKTLVQLKKEGKIRNVGISGYPVDLLYKIAKSVRSIPEIGTLDIVMSYSNMCLQNVTLLNYYERFTQDTGIKLLDNASILSMSLLRSLETKNFHPGSSALKDRCNKLAQVLKKEYNVELAYLATRFAIREWLGKQGRTVIGVSDIPELEDALKQYQLVLSRQYDETDDKLIKFSWGFLGEHFNETWPSGIEHDF